MTESADHVAILTRDLSKSYGDVTALDRLSFEVGRGAIFGCSARRVCCDYDRRQDVPGT